MTGHKLFQERKLTSSIVCTFGITYYFTFLEKWPKSAFSYWYLILSSKLLHEVVVEVEVDIKEGPWKALHRAGREAAI